jgi:hypothetical protein
LTLRRLRPAGQCLSPCVGQRVNTAVGTSEPAIDIAQQNFSRIGRQRPQIARALGPIRQKRGAGKRPLPVRRHDRRARATADCRIALTPAMFLHEPRPAPLIFARHWRRGADDHRDLAGLRHPKHAETQAATEIAETRIAFASLSSRRDAGGQPNLIAGGGPIDRLQNEFEIEAEFHLADDNERYSITSERDEIAASDLAFDGEAETFEKPFDGQVKRCFQGEVSAMRPLCPHTERLQASGWSHV